MKFNFRKISAIASSVLMIGASAGMAAAAAYPAPFVSGGAANVAVVYGTGSGVDQLDFVQAANIQSNLQSYMTGSTTTSSSSVTGGDSVLIGKSSDNLNINDTWSEVFTGTITDDNLKTLLADDTYIASDNDEFDYEQKISIGSPELKHFRDSDYESLAGLSERTPTIGFKISSNTYIMNYTIEFLEDISSDVVSSRMDDIEGSDIPLMGKKYYVSQLDNDTTNNAYFGKMILLDAATVGNVQEGETTTVSGHEVSIDWIDPDEVIFSVDGVRAPASGKLQKGNSYKLSDGSYIGVRDISARDVSGTLGSASFSIGTGKIEFPSHGADIKMNDETINGVKGYIHEATGNKVDKIVIEWKTDDEEFLAPGQDLVMPGFKALKFSMNDLIRNEEEKITVEKDSDTTVRLKMPFEKGDVEFNILYANASGEFTGIGKSATERLATTNSSSLFFYEKSSGNDFHDYFVATYNISKEGESYLLRASVTQDTTAARNETTIQSYENGAWTNVCEEKAASSTCDIGDITLTINEVNYTSGGNESVKLTAGTNVNFRSAITPGGIYVYLPYSHGWWNQNDIEGNDSAVSSNLGAVNFTAGSATPTAGHSWSSFWLFMVGEDKDETLGVAASSFNFTIDDTSNNKLQVSEVNNAGSGGGSTYGAEEKGDSTNIYEIYLKSDTAPRVLHYTKPDEDYAEVYYPTGDSETYGEVFLTEEGATITPGGITPGGGSLGEVLVKDSEVSSVSSKNLIIIGGSCINSAAAKVLGFSGATCGEAFTTATGVGSGEFLIKGVSGAYTTGKIALVVAGYNAADTVNAAKYLTNKLPDTSKAWKGTSSTVAATEITTA